jgi:hypothetical protein
MKEMKNIQVYSIGLCNLSVCALKDISIEEITEEINKEHPTGLNHGWTFSDHDTFGDGTAMPCPCDTDPETRKHYLFNC